MIDDDFNELPVTGPLKRLHTQLNALSHEAFLVRSQLDHFCAVRGLMHAPFNGLMDIFNDIDYSWFDIQGRDKRFVVSCLDAPLGTRDSTKMFTRKLVEIYCRQQTLMTLLSKRMYTAKEYNIANGWTITAISPGYGSEGYSDR